VLVQALLFFQEEETAVMQLPVREEKPLNLKLALMGASLFMFALSCVCGLAVDSIEMNYETWKFFKQADDFAFKMSGGFELLLIGVVYPFRIARRFCL